MTVFNTVSIGISLHFELSSTFSHKTLHSISEHGSLQLAEKAFRPAGGRLITLLFDHSNTIRPEVNKEAVMVYTMLGEDHSFGDEITHKSSEEERALWAKWCKNSYELFGSGQIKVSHATVEV